MKRLLAASMILTSFSVPAMAAEAEDLVEDTAIVEEAAGAAEEDVVDLSVDAEDVVGADTIVLDNVENVNALFTIMEKYDTQKPAVTETGTASKAQDEEGTPFTSCVKLQSGIAKADGELGKNGIKINFEAGKTYDLTLYAWMNNADSTKKGATAIVKDNTLAPVLDDNGKAISLENVVNVNAADAKATMGTFTLTAQENTTYYIGRVSPANTNTFIVLNVTEQESGDPVISEEKVNVTLFPVKTARLLRL